MRSVEREYVDNVGHAPREISDPEGQWDYTGTRLQRAILAKQVREGGERRVHAIDCDLDEDCTCFGSQEALF